MTPKKYLNQLNADYLNVHLAKEELFWTTYMATSDNHQGAAEAEKQWVNFISDVSRITELKNQIAAVKKDDDPTCIGLKGWLRFFEVNAIESDEAQKLKADLIQMEATLFERRQNYPLEYTDQDGNRQSSSLPELASHIKASNHESVRKSAHQAMLDLEQWVLENGFIDLVKKRNQFARSQGFTDFFDYSVQKTESMTSSRLFEILDDFEVRTHDRLFQSLQELTVKAGQDALAGHNFKFAYAGDAMRLLDPYVPFEKSLRRWVESFGRLNIEFSQAELTLDLLDRKGKYQNGFCHGPVPSFYDQDLWIPARVNFTSNASPSQIGSGYSGIVTLFHEGGHAAHFSNVKMNAPCFSQEFAPTSMAYAETQSMFCDSLLEDADWLKAYAYNDEGQAVTDDILKALTESNQPFRAYEERSILVVPYFERALYQLPDAELTPEIITQLARSTEKRILGLDVSPRPLMAIPHLLSNESACSYQGYLLANMAVYQTRAYLLGKFGYLSDNPNIGPLLAEHYWASGNHLTHSQTIESLTGEPFSARYLAEACNLTVEQAWQLQIAAIAAMQKRDRAKINPLHANINIVDGDHVLATNQQSDKQMFDQFEAYISDTYGRVRS